MDKLFVDDAQVRGISTLLGTLSTDVAPSQHGDGHASTLWDEACGPEFLPDTRSTQEAWRSERTAISGVLQALADHLATVLDSTDSADVTLARAARGVR